MKKYGILIQPSFNKVFFESSKQLMQSEIQILDQMVLQRDFHSFQVENIGGVDYISFQAKESLEARELEYLSRLSSLYCLFEIHSTPELLLKPLTLNEKCYFDEDIISIQKYTGKTNEEFTKLMLNIAVICSDYASMFTERLALLDPVCGRGTTLFQGLIYGYDVYGVEADKKSTHALMTFLKRYLMEKRYKHQLDQAKFRREGRIAGSSFKFTCAPTKEDFKEKPVIAQVVQDDTRFAHEHFKQNTFHVIVGDLPYGVQHGSPSNQGSLTRNPKGMIETALPGWASLLKKGGVLAVSWNTRILPREKLEEVFTKVGLKVLHSDALDKLVHVVDASITRDLLIAKKA